MISCEMYEAIVNTLKKLNIREEFNKVYLEEIKE